MMKVSETKRMAVDFTEGGSNGKGELVEEDRNLGLYKLR